jgi:hypothetical protein
MIEMVMMFAVEEARTFLLNNEEVYTLRPKFRKRGRNNTIKEPLVTELFTAPFAIGWVTFIKKIEDDSELEEFISKSGFDTVQEWRSKAKDSRFIYHVKLMIDYSFPEG